MPCRGRVSILGDMSADLPLRRKSRLRFSLFALLLFVTAICILLAWATRPQRYVVTALIHIGAVRPNIFDALQSSFNEGEFDMVRRSQVEMIKSPFVLQPALNDRKIAGLLLLNSQKDQLTWFRDHLEVDTPANSQLLAIRMHCTENEVNDYRSVLDCVAAAYLKAVDTIQSDKDRFACDVLAKEIESHQLKLDQLKKTIKELGQDGPEAQFQQSEFDALKEVMNHARISLIELQMQVNAPRRISLIQTATATKE